MPEVFENNWIQAEELMDTVFLNYVLQEKNYGIELAQNAMNQIKIAKSFCSNAKNYNTLYHTFNRTLMSAKLRKNYAQVYYAQRIWNRGPEFQSEHLTQLIETGVSEIKTLAQEIKNYRRKGPKGQYIWENDADIALELVREIEKSNIIHSAS